MPRLPIATLAILACWIGAAAAQQQQATTRRGDEPDRTACTAPLTATSTLSGVSGPVLVSQNGGNFNYASDGVVLGVGDRILVQERGEATFRLGTCVVALDDPSMITLEQVGDTIVAVEETETAALPVVGIPFASVLAAGAAAGTAGGVAAAGTATGGAGGRAGGAAGLAPVSQ